MGSAPSGSAGLVGSINPSLNLSLPSTAYSGSDATVSPYDAPTINFESPGSGSSSILQMGIIALAVIFVVKEIF